MAADGVGLSADSSADSNVDPGSTVMVARDRIERLGDWSSRRRWSRLHRDDSLPLRLDRKRIYVLPSGFGLFLAAVFTALLLGGLNYNNNPALLWTFLILAVAHNSLLAAHLALSGVALLRIHAQPVHAGRPLRVEFEFDADKARERDSMELLVGDRMTRFSLPGTASVTATLEIPSTRRGWMRLPRLRLSTTAPLGLVRAWAWMRPTTELLVYPALEKDAPPLPSGGGAQAGQRTQRHGEQPHHLRDYQSGDSLRQIAWKASARADQLLVREYESQQARELQLRWEDVIALPVEHRIQRLARWVVEADKRGLRFALDLPQEIIGPDSGDAHRHRCLRALAVLPHG